MAKYYPDSKVELSGFTAKFYDNIMNIASFGLYQNFIYQAIKNMAINSEDKILDFGAGTGRNALLMHKYLSEKGKIVGIEISNQMIKRFEMKTQNIPNITMSNQRIDIPIDFEAEYDKVFISFVLHGFPQDIRKNIINNAFNALKTGGEFIILDFNEFILKETPLYFRIPFKTIECKYAFDFVEREWKNILKSNGFHKFEEFFFLHKYVHLLKAIK